MDWMRAFLTVGILVGIFGIINFVLLVDHPSKVGVVVENSTQHESSYDEELKPIGGDFKAHKEEAGNDNLCRESTVIEEGQGISFWKAWLIPGVIQFAI